MVLPALSLVILKGQGQKLVTFANKYGFSYGQEQVVERQFGGADNCLAGGIYPCIWN